MTTALLVALLTPGPLGAAEPASSPFETAYSEQVLDFDNFDYDSDWQPADSPIQVRLVAHLGNTIAIDMSGDALYDWDAAQVWLEGTQDGGFFSLDMGLEITVSLKFDILGIQYEGEVGDPVSFLVQDEASFDPYLLEGDPDRPLIVQTDVEKQNVVEYEAVDLYVASATVRVDVSGTLWTEFASDTVTVTPADGGAAVVVDAEPDPFPLAFAEAALEVPAEAEAQLEGQILFTPELTAWPSVVVDLLGTEYTLAEFELPIDLGEAAATWLFDPEPLSFARPAPAPEDTGGPDDSGAGGPTVGEGCGCAAGGAGGLLAGLLALLGAAARRRRH
ncbi:MAG: MYXO-CTERM sorting domain-containing protein [Pseudomonadota bacterium]